MKSGIYKIELKKTGRLYVGSSKNAHERLLKHKGKLNRNQHENKALQNAWNTYGGAAFLLEQILSCPVEDLISNEQIIMDATQSYVKPYGYNIRKRAESNRELPNKSKIKAVLGKKYGRLTVIRETNLMGEYARWEFKCDCGKKVVTDAYAVRRGDVKSCGCYKKEVLRALKRHKHVAGEKYGRLTFLSPKEVDRSDSTDWLMQCDCGNKKYMTARRIARGIVISCGCLTKEVSGARLRTHGMRDSKEYLAWCNMRSRCYNPQNNRYTENGGRGITVCKEWKKSFESFYKDMGPCPEGKQISRKDINKGFNKGNCEWRTASEAMKNNRRSKIVTIDGKPYNVKDAEKILGIHRSSINQRARDRTETYQQATDHFARKKGLTK